MPIKCKTAYVTLEKSGKTRAVVFDDTPMKREIMACHFYRTFYEPTMTIHILADFPMPHEMAVNLKNAIYQGQLKTYHFPSYTYKAIEKQAEIEDKKLPTTLVQQRFG